MTEAAGKTTIYLAGPLFTQGERNWNAGIAEHLRSVGYKVLLPQEQATNIVKSTGALTKDERTALFAAAVESVRQCDVVIAILDGPDSDSGTCFECGLAFALKRPVIGVRTDLRLGGDDFDLAVNLMLSQSCREVLWIGMEALRQSVPDIAARIASAVARLV